MNQQLIIYKNAGSLIPEDFLKKSLEMYPGHTGYIGFAVQDTEDGKADGAPFIEADSWPKNITIEEAMKVQTTVQNLPLMFVLGDMRTKDHYDSKTDGQPFLFKAADGSVVLAVAIEGDFSAHAVTGSKHSDEHNLWVDMIHPMLHEKYEASADLGEFYEKIRSGPFKKALLGAMGHRGSIVMMPVVGEPVSFDKNELLGQYDWGQCSAGTEIINALTKAAKPVEEKKPVEAPKAKGGRFDTILNDSGAKAPTAPAKDTPAPVIKEQPKSAVTNKQMATSEAALNAGFFEVHPPKKLDKNALAAWYRTFTADGQLVKDHHKRVSLKVPISLAEYANRDITTKDQAVALAAEVKAIKAGHPVASKEADKKLKPTFDPSSPADVKIPEKKEDKTPLALPKKDDKKASAFMPVLETADLEKAKDIVLDFATRDASKYPTPLELQKSEAKFPAFSAQTGIKTEDMFSWRIEDIKKLGAESSDALAMAFLEMRALARASVKLEVKPPADKPEIKTDPAPVEKPVAPVEAPAAKPSALDFLKKPLKKAA